MKNVIVFFCVIGIVTIIVSPSSAQWSIPGLSSIPPILDGNSIKTSFLCGYFNSSVSIGGEQDNPLRGATSHVTLTPRRVDPLFLYDGVKLNYVHEGIAFGLTCEARTTLSAPRPLGRIGFMSKFWYFLQLSTGTATEHWESSATPFLSQGSPIRLDLGDHASWDTDSDWWRYEGYMTAEAGEGFDLLLGYRWEHYHTNLKNPETNHANPQSMAGATYPVPFHSPGDEAEIAGLGLIPLVGLRIQRSGVASKLSLTAVGWPYLSGGVGMTVLNYTVGQVSRDSVEGTNYGFDTNGKPVSGFLVDLSCEYSRQSGQLGNIGAFVKWNYIEFRSRTDVPGIAFTARWTHRSATGTASAEQPSGTGGGVTRQKCFTIGATITRQFQIPWL